MNYYKHALYFAIGFITALASTKDPITWREIAMCVGAGLVALKALGSNPNKDTKE